MVTFQQYDLGSSVMFVIVRINADFCDHSFNFQRGRNSTVFFQVDDVSVLYHFLLKMFVQQLAV